MTQRDDFLSLTKQFHLSLPTYWSGTVKHIASVLFTFAGSSDGGGICASIATIAKHAGERGRTVERVLRQLRAGGFLADDGWRVFDRPSGGGKVRVRARRLVLAAITRGPAIEPDTSDGLGTTIETDTHDGFDATETDTGDGFDRARHTIEPDIFDGSLQVEPDIFASSLRIEPVTGDTQTKRKKEPRERSNRESGARARRNGAASMPADKAAPSRQPRAPRQKPGMPIDPSWQPDSAGIAFAVDRGIEDLPGEVQHFRDHHLARGSVMRDWPAAWRTWCSNDQKFRERRRSNGNGVPVPNSPKVTLRKLSDFKGLRRETSDKALIQPEFQVCRLVAPTRRVPG